ncbi:hypothetical protein GCM10011414_02900 [Croceivirga lutea]|uniref:hypothetical protein n=1 Tax=Croceivirga lutea TaxID=1775167 RepID=UPI00163A9288|nr:hypothetical protein [Croceivirga lutea]GGG36942.1 hypothetical protein GCM10011414_02900 [Croceivirga lutea]
MEAFFKSAILGLVLVATLTITAPLLNAAEQDTKEEMPSEEELEDNKVKYTYSE